MIKNNVAIAEVEAKIIEIQIAVRGKEFGRNQSNATDVPIKAKDE
jgi:hypothetical protein